MKRTRLPELDEAGRIRWKHEIEALLDQRNLGQRRLAEAIAEFRGKDLSEEDDQLKAQNRYKPEVSRFVGGDPVVLRRWFGPPVHPNLQAVAAELLVDPDDLLVLLELAATGEGEGGWHPAFPGIRAGEIEIRPVLAKSGFTGRFDASAWMNKGHQERDAAGFENAARLLAEAIGSGQSIWTWIVGPTGSGRHTVVRILARAVQRITGRPPSWTVRDAEPPEGWIQARATSRGVTIAILERPPAGVPEIDLRLHLGVWGATEIRAVVEALAARKALDARQSQVCGALVDQYAKDPNLLGESAWPVQAIQVLADTARHGKVRTAREVRVAKTQAAWNHACRTRDATEVLGRFDDKVLERYFADLYVDGPSAPWTRASVAEAIDRLQRASAGLVRPDVGGTVTLRLLDRLEASRQPDGKLVDEIRAHLERPTGAALLHGLLAGSVLRQVDEDVEAVDEGLALFWAARGLAGQGFRLERWERLFEYGWERAALEMAVAVDDPMEVVRAMAEAPDWIAVDRDRWLVVFLASSARKVCGEMGRQALVSAWASSMWTTLYATFQNAVDVNLWGQIEATSVLESLLESLRKLSFRYCGILPELSGSSLEGALKKHVPLPIRRFADAWRKSDARFKMLDPCPTYLGPGCTTAGCWNGRWSIIEWAEDSGQAQDFLIQLMAPAQCPPLDPAMAPLRGLLQWMRGCTEAEEVLLAANAGADSARAIVAGSQLFGQKQDPDPVHLAAWTAIPLEGRLRWIGNAGIQTAGARALSALLRPPTETPETKPTDDQVIEVLRRLPVAEVASWLRGSLADPPRAPEGLVPLDRSLAIRAAEAVRLTQVLEDITGQVAAATALHRMGRPDPLRALWRTSGDENIREEAAASLLLLGDDLPLADWATDPSLGLPAKVAHDLAGGPDLLRRAWRVGARGPRREEILALAGARSDDGALPCNWAFEAVRESPPAVRRVFAVLHREDPRVLEILRDLWVEEAADSRERAYWAVLIHAHLPAATEVEQTLRRWALEDPLPFSGPNRFHDPAGEPDEAFRTCGGVGWLLAMLGRADPDTWTWLPEAVSRLWNLRIEKGGGWEAEPWHAESERPVPVALGEIYGGPDRILFGLLDRFGFDQRVQEAFDPARSPETGTDPLAVLALDWWRKHATSAEIDAMLEVDDWRGEELERLLWEAGDARTADRLYARLQTAAWKEIDPSFLRTLCETCPEVAVRAFSILLDRFPKRQRDLCWAIAIADAMDIDWSRSDGRHEQLRRLLRKATLAGTTVSKGGATCPAR